MKLSLVSLALLFVTVGCGEDYSKGRRALIPRIDPILPEDEFIVPSQMHRMRGNEVFSTRTEIDHIVKGTLPLGYRTIPLMGLDDEGKNNVNVRTRTSLGRPNTNCGLTFGQTIAQRMDDCSSTNLDRAAWIGNENGAAGESTWRLVARNETLEVWIDTRTGHLWSDVVSITNWCNASGNTESGNGVNCTTLATNVSCANSPILSLNGISWRLPTRNDYLQADINGLRFVLKDSTTGLWTATLDSRSLNRSEAWVYVQTQGTLEKASLTQDRNVRCIGAASL